MLKLLTLTLFIFSINCCASESDVVKIAATTKTGYTNNDGTGIYWDIVEEVFKSNYQLNKITTSWTKAQKLVSSASADILIGTSDLNQDKLLFSEHHIDLSYPVHAIFDASKHSINTLNDLSGLTIVAKRGTGLKKHLNANTRYYSVKSVYKMDNLVKHNRVDVALTYSYNLHLANSEPTLKQKVLIPEHKIYVAFSDTVKGKLLKKHFDRVMKVLIKNDGLKKLFPTEMAYEHANYQKREERTGIDWVLTPKIFKKKSQDLEVLKQELHLSQYLSKQIPNYKFKLSSASGREIDNIFGKSKKTVCTLIPTETPYLSGSAFSESAFVFMKPRLYVLKEGRLKLPQKQSSAYVISKLIKQVPLPQIAISNNSVIQRKLEKHLHKNSYSKLYIVDDLNYQNMVSMLFSKRIDAFIAWPSMMAELLESNQTVEALNSFQIEEPLGNNIFSFVRCSDTFDGNRIVDEINVILQNPTHQEAIYNSYLETLDIHSKQEFINLMQL